VVAWLYTSRLVSLGSFGPLGHIGRADRSPKGAKGCRLRYPLGTHRTHGAAKIDWVARGQPMDGGSSLACRTPKRPKGPVGAQGACRAASNSERDRPGMRHVANAGGASELYWAVLNRMSRPSRQHVRGRTGWSANPMPVVNSVTD
jgi:hypothetical protein